MTSQARRSFDIFRAFSARVVQKISFSITLFHVCYCNLPFQKLSSLLCWNETAASLEFLPLEFIASSKYSSSSCQVSSPSFWSYQSSVKECRHEIPSQQHKSFLFLIMRNSPSSCIIFWSSASPRVRHLGLFRFITQRASTRAYLVGLCDAVEGAHRAFIASSTLRWIQRVLCQ